MDSAITLCAIDDLVKACYENSCNKGFWDGQDPVDVGPLKIALMHSELSEALEVMRRDYSDDTTIADLTEEFADTIIRIFDYCGAAGLPIGDALLAKMAKNRARPHKHGKAF